MNMRLLPALLFAGLLAAPLVAAGESGRIFVAAAFTKEQRNSSEPTDSGVLLRAASGRWERLGPKIMSMNHAAAAAADPSVIYLACGNGIVRSRDGGESWRMTTGWQVSDALELAVDPADPLKVYAATAWGQWRTRDGGDTWEECNAGLVEKYAQRIRLDRLDSRRLLLGTWGGLYVSANGAGRWDAVQGLPAAPVLALTNDGEDPRQWLVSLEGRGVWRSSDNGMTWAPTAPELVTANVYGLSLAPHDVRRMAAGGWNVGVWISTDGGATWRQHRDLLPAPHVMALAYERARPGRLLVSTFEEGSVFTDDDGISWGEAGLYGAYVRGIGHLPALR